MKYSNKPKVGRLAKARIPDKFRQNKFAKAIVEGENRVRAAQLAGYSDNAIPRLMADPHVVKQIEDGLSNAAIAAGISREWVLSKLKEVAERCLQARPVLDKLGHETGLFVFDASGANRSLELLGKHLKVFGDDSSAQAQLGAAVIRLLAQEAQAGRVKAVDAQIVEQEQKGPTKKNGNVLASMPASCPPSNQPSTSPPVDTGS